MLSRVGPFIGVPLRIGQREVTGVLDTRLSGGVTIPQESESEYAFAGPVRVVGQARGAGIGTIEPRAGMLADEMRLGRHRFPSPTLVIKRLPPEFPRNPVVGSDLLRHFRVAVDQASMLARFERADDAPFVLGGPAMGEPREAPAREGGRRLGIAFGFTGNSGAAPVELVAPGSLGESAGFKFGDMVVEVGHRPAKRVTREQLGELIREWKPLTFTGERSGRPGGKGCGAGTSAAAAVVRSPGRLDIGGFSRRFAARRGPIVRPVDSLVRPGGSPHAVCVGLNSVRRGIPPREQRRG